VYINLIFELPKFPDRAAILPLRAAGVRYILIHRRFYDPQEFDRLMLAVDASTRLWPVRTFGEGTGQVVVVELNYEPE
jgi:hypothetical protein